MKIKINGMKRKVEILGLNEIIDENCFLSMPLTTWKNRPMTEDDYKEMCEKEIKNVDRWFKSRYSAEEKERVSDCHSHRIYIRVI